MSRHYLVNHIHELTLMLRGYISLRAISILILLLLVVNSVYFGWLNHHEFIRSDQWRFIELYLYPIYSNSFEIKMLWSDYHAEPLTALLFILSEKYFDLTVNLNFYVGIFFKAAFVFLFIYILRKRTELKGWLWFLSVACIASIFLSLKSTNEYSWSLVLLSNIWLFAFLLMLIYIDKQPLSISRVASNFLLLIMLSAFMIATRDLAIICFASIAAALILSGIRDKEWGKSFLFLMILFMSMLVHKGFYLFSEIESVGASVDLSVLSALDLFGVVESYAIAIGSGLVGFKAMKSLGVSLDVVRYLCYLLFVVYLAAIFFCVKNQQYRVTIIPLVLMVFPLFFATAVIFFRYPPVEGQVNWLVASPRYTKMYEIGIMAMFFSWAMALKGKDERCGGVLAYASVAICVIAMNFYTINNSWSFSKYVVNAQSKIELYLFEYSDDTNGAIPKALGGDRFSSDKVEFLREHSLNVFSPDYTFQPRGFAR